MDKTMTTSELVQAIEDYKAKIQSTSGWCKIKRYQEKAACCVKELAKRQGIPVGKG